MLHYHLSLLPERTSKPRQRGITMVMDKGLSLREAEDFISVASEYTDFIKLGFGTSLITPGIEKKIKTYRKAGLMVYPGGTLFEAFIIRDQFEQYRQYIRDLGMDTVEISDGSMKVDHDRKCEYIRTLSAEFTVLSEVGSKEAGVEIPSEKWMEMMLKELEAGSFKVIAEAREGGNVGIYDKTGKTQISLINEILSGVAPDKIIWEAPLKSQQAWFINHFGPEVNLGNISPQEVIPLETLRLGLRGDTFFSFLPENLKKLKLE